MDNLKYYNDSLAYDFEKFMPRTERKDDNIIKMPDRELKVRTRRQVKTMSVSAFAVLVCFVMLAALCSNIFLRLQINEVNNKINDMNVAINQLDSQKTELEMELERKISYSNIELQAAELGMVKRNKDQVKYIHVNDKNAALVDDGIVVSETN